MRLWLIALVAVALVGLGLLPRITSRLCVGPLGWALAWAVSVWAVLELAFVVPVPRSVIHIYLGIVFVALLIYLTSDRERFERAQRPAVAFLTERRFVPYLVAVAVAIPALVVANIWLAATAPPTAPAFGRTVHPAPPDQIMGGSR
jgi:hypothetical protein